MRAERSAVVQGGRHRTISQHRCGDPHHLGNLGVGHHSQPEQQRSPGLAIPRCCHVEHRTSGDGLQGGGHGVRTDDLGLDRVGGRGLWHLPRRIAGPHHRSEAVVQRPELEEIEQSLHLDHVGMQMRRSEVHLDGGVTAQQHEVEVHPRLGFIRRERLSQLRGLGGHVLEDAVESAVGGDELCGGLLSHTRHAGKVVARVSAQRCVLGVLLRRDTRAFEDAGLVVERIVAHAAFVVEHSHKRILNELVAIAVAGDDDDVVPRAADALDHGGDDVVCLPTGRFERRDAKCCEHLTDEAHLLAKDVGGGFSLCFVGRVREMAERGLWPVEGNHHRLRLVVLDEVDEHRCEAVHRVGDLPRCGSHVGRQREKRPIRQGVSVQQHDRAHVADTTGRASLPQPQ